MCEKKIVIHHCNALPEDTATCPGCVLEKSVVRSLVDPLRHSVSTGHRGFPMIYVVVGNSVYSPDTCCWLILAQHWSVEDLTIASSPPIKDHVGGTD